MRNFDILIVFSCVVTIFVIWIQPISIDNTAIPEIVNGASATTAIIIGLIGLMVAMEGSRNQFDFKLNKKRAFATMILLSVSIAIMYASYLAFLFIDFSYVLKISLVSMAIAVFSFVSSVVFLGHRFFSIQKKSHS